MPSDRLMLPEHSSLCATHLSALRSGFSAQQDCQVVGFDVGRDYVQYSVFVEVAQGEFPAAFSAGRGDQRIGAKAAVAVAEEDADAGLGDGNEIGLAVQIEVEKRQVPASVAHAQRRRVCEPPVWLSRMVA